VRGEGRVTQRTSVAECDSERRNPQTAKRVRVYKEAAVAVVNAKGVRARAVRVCNAEQ